MTEHRIHGSVSLVAYFKLIDLSILELNIAILHCMFSEIKNAVYLSDVIAFFVHISYLKRFSNDDRKNRYDPTYPLLL
jgi:hypothetical protein